ncbi:MAG: hypothetical protein S4CHLAM81_04710 [Chlamydiales bacterium]|nr:hypothetical protein [Chlamydiales bacterium]MCH9635260.1 hypothetical protein [Chlamydiales bacterium]
MHEIFFSNKEKKFILGFMQYSAFSRLNSVQFLAAVNENLFKLIAAYFLIAQLGVEKTNEVMATVGTLFILPFLLFSNVGGVFADRFSKSQIIWITRICELVTVLFGTLFFSMQWATGAYIALFSLSTSAAIFGPAKYGAIPEVLPIKRILFGNSVIAAFTYLGIIIGTALASFIVGTTGHHFVYSALLTVLIAFSGTMISLTIPKTAIENSKKRFPPFVYSEIWQALKQMRSIPSLLMATFAFAYLLFLGGFVQLNLIPYAIQILNLSDVYGGYLFMILALGLGCGAYMTDRISQGKIRLQMVPYAGLGISIILLLMYLWHDPWWLVAIWMALLGFLGGIFLVPPQAYILAASPKKDRGRNFATANFFSFFCALLAAGAIYLLNVLLKLTPATSFLFIAILNAITMFFVKFSRKS